MVMQNSQSKASIEIASEKCVQGGEVEWGNIIAQLRTAGVKLKDIFLVMDYDWTMAPKDTPESLDDARLKRRYFEILSQLTPKLGTFLVSTARGEAAILEYLRDPEFVKEFGPLQNTSLGSNSGHILKKNIANILSKSVEIPIEKYLGNKKLQDEIVDGIHSILKDLYDDADPNTQKKLVPSFRELCGAMVYNGIDADKADALHARAQELVEALSKRTGTKVKIDCKGDLFTDEYGNVKKRGYIDVKPEGMNKGYTLIRILRKYLGLTKKSVIVVVGDAQSDYPMVEKANELVQQGKARAVVFIDVGGQINDTLELTQKELENGKGGTGIVIKRGTQSEAIEGLYTCLDKLSVDLAPTNKVANDNFGKIAETITRIKNVISPNNKGGMGGVVPVVAAARSLLFPSRNSACRRGPCV